MISAEDARRRTAPLPRSSIRGWEFSGGRSHLPAGAYGRSSTASPAATVRRSDLGVLGAGHDARLERQAQELARALHEPVDARPRDR